MKRDVLIGVDGGTGGIRCCFYDSVGTVLGFAQCEYETRRPHNGWAEQSPASWWQALKQCIAEIMGKTGIAKERILGIATATTCCSVVVCARNGLPLRDSIIWMDVRAFAQAEEIARLTGEHLSAEWMPCKLLWLKHNELENYQQAEVFCEYQDWMTYMLTGKWSVNINTACNWGYNNREKGFPASFYNAIGLPDAIAKFPSDHVYAVGDKIGSLSPFAAKELGLDTETIVAQAGIDSSVGMLGMGVSGYGDAALMTGSSNLLMVLTDKLMFSEDSTINAGPDHLLPGLYTAYRGQVSSGSILAWFRQEFCKDLPYEKAFDILNEQAKDIPAGSEGLLVLDYWQGNRHPYYDTKVRGLIYGYTLSHTRAHVYRALMEGIAYGVQNLFEQFRAGGMPIQQIFLSGGSVNSELFLQIYADVCNVKIHIAKDRQSVCLGSAITAAVATGLYADLPQAVKAMVTYQRTIYPDVTRHSVYRQIFAQYARLYPELKDWMHQTTDICLAAE